MEDCTFNDLSPEHQNLVLEAEKVRETAYAPHSKFLVGAALLTDDGEVYGGSNVENCSWMVVCAERSAIVHANAHGKRAIRAIAITARSLDFDLEDVIAPCGPCRQMIYEASDVVGHDIELILCNTDHSKIKLSSIRELLPLGYGPSVLKTDLSHFLPK